MNKRRLFAALCCGLLAFACSRETGLTGDPEKNARIESAFREKVALFNPDEGFFEVFNNSALTADERLALKFLYAYAPLTDMTVPPELLLEHVRTTLEARREMPWADSLSDDLFLHFVLPARVNNEAVDSSRTVFYRELKDRVNGLSLREAALEVNHWCHEKAVYAPSDARTSSPLATVRTAYGRCGEESVFTVAALRAVGIPARQVYTPRWAHSDDNHAWVEVWGGDRWYYMGACEPDVCLDMGWFTAPATRAMLMHTKVYGDYRGPEEVMSANPCYTEINVTENYAPVRKVTVTVEDENGRPVPDAEVEFRIYNYAEFYPVARKTSDAEGCASVTMGLGDVLVWAAKEGAFGFAKLSVADTDKATVRIDRTEKRPGTFDIDIVPPAEGRREQTVTAEQRKRNAERLAQEDSVRMAYIATFPTPEAAGKLAKELNLDVRAVERHLTASRGNYDQIGLFLREASKEDGTAALQMLDVLTEKDLRDARAEVLLSHFRHALRYRSAVPEALFAEYLLNPRVENESLVPYRDFFTSRLEDKLEMVQIIELAKSIRTADDMNAAVARVTPDAVLRLKMADGVSRDIFFVAMARTYGYPARLEPAAKKPQYFDGGQWVDVEFGKLSALNVPPKGWLTVAYKPTKAVDEPKYGTHFTVSKLGDDGFPTVLELDNSVKYDMGGGSSARRLFAKPVLLEPGRYLLTSGTRLADGGVLANLTFFDVRAHAETSVNLPLRENQEDIFVLGSIDPEARLTSCADGSDKSLLDLTGRGYYLLGLVEAGREPVNHSMRALSAIRETLAQWGRPVVLVFPDEEQFRKFDPAEFGPLPDIRYAVDDRGAVAAMLEGVKLNPHNLPLYVVADSFGRVVFTSEGYQINLGDNLQKIIAGLR